MFNFFGLTQEYKVLLHDEIFDLCNHGNGFTFNEVFQMPIWVRKYFLNKLIDIKQKENDEIENIQNQSGAKSTKRIYGPNGATTEF